MFFPLLLPGVFSSSFFLERRRVVSAGGWRVHFSLFLRSSLHTTLVVVHPWWHGFVLTLFFPKNLLLFFPVCMFRVLKKREREEIKGKRFVFCGAFPSLFLPLCLSSLFRVRTNKFRAKRATTKNDTTRHYVCSTKHEFYRRESCRGEIRQDDATVRLLLPEWFSARESCRFLFSVFYIFALYKLVKCLSLAG